MNSAQLKCWRVRAASLKPSNLSAVLWDSWPAFQLSVAAPLMAASKIKRSEGQTGAGEKLGIDNRSSEEGHISMEHIVAVFKTDSAAAAAERALEGAGIPRSAMSRYTHAETERLEAGSSAAGATETSHSGSGGFWAWLLGEDADTTTTRSAYPTEGEVYDRQARAGNTILSVRLNDDSLIHQAVTILDAHHPIEIDEHADETEPTSRTSGSFVQAEPAGKAESYSTVADSAAPSSVGQASDIRPAGMSGGLDRAASVAPSTGDEVIPLAEEQIEVGKRKVDRGTTRVRRYVVEKPVEQNVTLRGERVTIERRHPVGGTAAAGGAFEERTVEVRETEEVPVVEKKARVVEEVAVRKEATERTETVKDTVRREEVEVTGNDHATHSRAP
jgi:uncharacterized protein (TIGR02271 family)